METLLRYFPDLTDAQCDQFAAMQPFYEMWNTRINVISRKDMDLFYERHVLHSLSIALAAPLGGIQRVLDIGTGGGFPGIPLAILYPDIEFLLTDSIRKKIGVVDSAIEHLNLKNVQARWTRTEEVKGRFDLAVTRAVARMDKLIGWTGEKAPRILALKGGDLQEELADVKGRLTIIPLFELLPEPFMETKMLVDWQA